MSGGENGGQLIGLRGLKSALRYHVNGCNVRIGGMDACPLCGGSCGEMQFGFIPDVGAFCTLEIGSFMPDDENIDYQTARRELERAIDEIRALGGLSPIYGPRIKASVAVAPSQALSELEDRALALCEGEYVELPIAIEILESWFDRPISASELRMVFERLTKLGLIECQLGNSWAFSNVVPESSAIGRTKFRATHKGVEYLKASANPDKPA